MQITSRFKSKGWGEKEMGGGERRGPGERRRPVGALIRMGIKHLEKPDLLFCRSLETFTGADVLQTHISSCLPAAVL